MRTIRGVPLDELKADVRHNRFTPDRTPNSRRKYDALKSIADGSVFWVLSDTPSQFEDIVAILVDDRLVVSFELPREPEDAKPVEIEFQSLDDYRNETDEWGQAKLDFALEFAREALYDGHD
jgi:hypothetical protein